MTHIDLFSGIGGFALALDNVYGKEKIKHIFCDNDEFCQAVLKKHWPNAYIYSDIRTLTADSERTRLDAEYSSTTQTIQSPERTNKKENTNGGRWTESSPNYKYFILTGGFPCQPFSQAGKKRGTADDRYLWPEMLRVIREFHPRWVVGENVGGLVTWNDGMVLEQVHTDLESEGYEVQAFIIPACGLNAPHRRDRVWIVGYSHSIGRSEQSEAVDTTQAPLEAQHHTLGRHTQSFGNATHTNDSRDRASEGDTDKNRKEEVEDRGVTQSQSLGQNGDATDPTRGRRGGRSGQEHSAQKRKFQSGQQQGSTPRCKSTRRDWDHSWIEVATRLCRVDDEFSYWVDGRGKKRNSRNARLKALGNAIVPAVAEQIMYAIRLAEQK